MNKYSTNKTKNKIQSQKTIKKKRCIHKPSTKHTQNEPTINIPAFYYILILLYKKK